ncbi:MAG: cell division protein FtsZ, partial [Solirubrobacterales bacterium]
MARNKRASMREGPLADLFRTTDESVAPDQVRVTANDGGAGQVEVAVEAPVGETPTPEPVPEP